MATAFGLSRSGKDAQGAINEIPRWYFDQYKSTLQGAEENYNNGRNWENQVREYLNNILNMPTLEAGGSFGDIDIYGRRAMPGVDETNTARMAQLEQLKQQLSQIPGASQIVDQLNASTNALSGASGNLGNAINDLIGNLYTNIRGWSDSAFGDNKQNIIDSYDTATGSIGGAYDESLQNLKGLGPYGDLQAAASSRAFAPAMAAAQRRLRASGIDPNSPEASGILQSVDAARARSADDILSRTLADQIAQKNNLTLGRARDTSQLGLDKGALLRDNTMSQLSANSGLAQWAGDRQQQNWQDTYDRTKDIYNRRDQNALTGRDLGVQDLNMSTSLSDLFNQAMLQNLGLQNERFNAGVSGVARGRAEQNSANQQFMDLALQALQRSMGYNAQAGQMGPTAQGMFDTAYGREQASSGWAGKLLGGIGSSLLGMIPGVGSVLGPMAAGATGAIYGQPSQPGLQTGQRPITSGGGTPNYAAGSAAPTNPSSAWGNIGKGLWGGVTSIADLFKPRNTPSPQAERGNVLNRVPVPVF